MPPTLIRDETGKVVLVDDGTGFLTPPSDYHPDATATHSPVDVLSQRLTLRKPVVRSGSDE